ncbi:FAD-binding oxidoreductase [Lentibacter algarum]|uniref:FAD-binding oxidoreductase n=1 Tax=Lentibacter algarum TaxID=576131 RepID=UPI001C08F648|nr:FAD-binding oxidoreductase [Lentibacter algarum]MBU2982960.1 FAD-binding oxidoreductase [Lentibacter algarum]
MSLYPANAAFIKALSSVLPEAALRAPEQRYLEEPRGKWRGKAGIVAAPSTVQDVAAAIRCAAEACVPVVPYGGGTGLVGAQVMPDGPAPLLLSLERMNKIRAIYPEENVVIAEAGATLQSVQEAASEAKRLFPLSIASQGTAQIGGNLATNAGGLNVLRYGNARDLCLGLEAVLPNGDIWHGLTRLRKDNTGYDLRNLLIGSEGTLGVITAAALKLFPRPANTGTAAFVVPNPAAALSLLSLAREQLGETISAFELIHRQGLEFLTERLPDVRQMFAEPPEWSVLIDLGLPAGLDPQAEFETLFARALEADLVSDGLIAQNAAQSQAFWAVRESIPEANRLVGGLSSHDVSLPLSKLAEFIKTTGAALAAHGDYRINCFGHLGDGNLHYNVYPALGKTRESYGDAAAQVQEITHDIAVRLGGSFSAEHGVGRHKVDALEHYGDPTRLAAMRATKNALDPLGIMNPGAVLRTVF